MYIERKIIIIVNKYWECDPVCWVLTNKYVNETCGVVINWPDLVNYPSYGPSHRPLTLPRLIFVTGKILVELWCISDLLNRYPYTPSFQSSSEIKMRHMGEIFPSDGKKVDMVIGVGTASSGPFCPDFEEEKQSNINGSVVVGGKIFIHDGHPRNDQNNDSKWRWKYFDKIMNSSLVDPKSDKLLVPISKSVFNDLDSLLLCPPNNPGPKGQHVYVDGSYVAIGNVNVTDYKEYSIKDAEAGEAFKSFYPASKGGVSVETTHGLIYAEAMKHFNEADPPFLFISGIVDRFTQYDQDVKPRIYAQNVTGAHNAGVVLAVILTKMM